MHKYTVLAVDDDPKILKAIKRILSSESIKVITAIDPEFGLDILNQIKVDLIISDYLMPEMSGLEFLQIAKERQPNILSILQSGFADFPIAKDAINKIGVAGLLEKPWNPKELTETVKNLLSQTRATLKEIAEDEKESHMRELEKEHPGITKIEKDKEGYVLIPDDEQAEIPDDKQTEIDLDEWA